ncbi:hypothetical protein [Streptomyces himalayensis]|uniref:Uncharacterized protein n=1 Tax=Streptomyces himalayensis subsp. himalayensis TaxID=2756131 RepID=A0A7W0DRT9_9ACTN|nr:hypothetical protein [Streptomyces himalayensis]MBA2949588.1 hypothetical protein [Streptomyces himalayensis subsp. himalayensis]
MASRITGRDKQTFLGSQQKGRELLRRPAERRAVARSLTGNGVLRADAVRVESRDDRESAPPYSPAKVRRGIGTGEANEEMETATRSWGTFALKQGGRFLV